MALCAQRVACPLRQGGLTCRHGEQTRFIGAPATAHQWPDRLGPNTLPVRPKDRRSTAAAFTFRFLNESVADRHVLRVHFLTD